MGETGYMGAQYQARAELGTWYGYYLSDVMMHEKKADVEWEQVYYP